MRREGERDAREASFAPREDRPAQDRDTPAPIGCGATIGSARSHETLRIRSLGVPTQSMDNRSL